MTTNLSVAVTSTSELTRPEGTKPWWKRGHSYWFVTVLVANVLCAVAIIPLLVFLQGNVSAPIMVVMFLPFFMMGMVAGQMFLLGMWLALGGLNPVIRMLMGSLLLCVSMGLFLVALGTESSSAELSEMLASLSPILIGMGSMVLMLQAALVPLRWLRGWRVDFDPAYHSANGNRRMQLSVKHFMLLSIYCALPLALCRSAEEFLKSIITEEEVAGISFTFVLYSFVGTIVLLATAGPMAWAVLSRKKGLLRLTLASTWCGIFALVAAQGISKLTSQGFWEHALITTGVMATACATITGNLFALRLAGLKFFSVYDEAGQSEQPCLEVTAFAPPSSMLAKSA